jgi:hypothetical protein
MKLLKYINTTNPSAHINGCAILTEEEAAVFITKQTEVKLATCNGKKFIASVGDGFIVFSNSADLDSCTSIIDITDFEAEKLQEEVE